MNDEMEALRKLAGMLVPHRDALLEEWLRSLREVLPPSPELRPFCARSLDAYLDRLGRGEIEELLRDEAQAAGEAARAGAGLHPVAVAVRALERSAAPFLVASATDLESLGQSLVALESLGLRRATALLLAQEEEWSRRLIEAQERAARADERAKDLARQNAALQQDEARSQHRADQIGLLNKVARRLAAVLDPERLMQEAAEIIRASLNHTYVGVVVLDDEGVLVGRWAGRPGIGRQSAGRAQGPARGIIGRSIRKRAPQVVGDVALDPDYHPDVPGIASEMVIPLLDEGEVVGGIDFQSERKDAFDLDDVAAGEATADFLVVALRNARLFAQSRRGPASE
jgi:putative methionine-R-sulfoxide reductase with GAF domain